MMLQLQQSSKSRSKRKSRSRDSGRSRSEYNHTWSKSRRRRRHNQSYMEQIQVWQFSLFKSILLHRIAIRFDINTGKSIDDEINSSSPCPSSLCCLYACPCDCDWQTASLICLGAQEHVVMMIQTLCSHYHWWTMFRYVQTSPDEQRSWLVVPGQ